MKEEDSVMDQKSNPNQEVQNPVNISPSATLAFQVFYAHLSNICSHILKEAEQNGHHAPNHLVEYFPERLNLGFYYFSDQLLDLYRWLFTSREVHNFTYDITDENKEYLSALVSLITKVSVAQARAYIDELNSDHELKEHVRSLQARSTYANTADDIVNFGRRLGWYAFARATKPKIVLETGVDQGLGSCILAAALKRNTQEGAPGRYYGIDILPEAGYLLTGDYAKYGVVLYGDAIETIGKLQHKIDLYINDSDHSSEYELKEYRAMKDKLADNCIILGDNSHSTNKLFQFSQETNRQFVFFQEKPKDHWYPGAGIGVSFKSN